MKTRSQPFLTKNLAALILTLLLLGLVGYLVFAQLGEMYITDYDEARHGVNAYEMIRNRDYWVHTYQGTPDRWNLKPPLSFWLIALSYRLFGYSAFALRFFSALAALLASGALALWAYRRQGVWAGAFTVLVIAGNSAMYGLHFARFGDADAQYQLFFTIAMLFMLRSGADFRWLYGSALLFGLAFLEKGLHALMIPAICLGQLILTGGWRSLTFRRVGGLLLAGLAPIAPWAIVRGIREGVGFFTSMVATDVVGRAGAMADDTGLYVSAFGYYVRVLWDNPAMMICLGLCLMALGVMGIGRMKLTLEKRQALVGCALWFLLPIALYSLANVKFRWYIYSAFFALPALTAVALSAAFPCGRYKRSLTVASVTAALCLAVLATLNVGTVSQIRFHHMVQSFIRTQLERDLDGGRHVYIQYNENSRNVWMQADMLTALLYGDAVCLDGGTEAFLADEESALLLITKEANMEEINELYEIQPVRDENYYVAAFEKS